MTVTQEAIAAAVEADSKRGYHIASARKTGRNPKWPYVPVLLDDQGRQHQILARAFETRSEAVAYAEDHLARGRALLAEQLAMPNKRALREWHGLPREMES